MILAADVGGTNIRFILSEFTGKKESGCVEKSYLSTDFDDFYQCMSYFLSENKTSNPIQSACFAVAGPLDKGCVQVTNLPWEINESTLKNKFNISNVKIINDFYAVAFGISELKQTDFITVYKGKSTEEIINKDAAIIGAGTGLGVSHRVWRDDCFQVFSSEAGHVGFAPENQEQIGLLIWMQKKYSHVSLEQVLSGGGIKIIYNFFKQSRAFSESPAVHKAMKKNDSAQVITQYALQEKDELCIKSLDCFIDIYGSAAGNVVLHYYPVSEIYIAGGIATKIKNKMLSQRFIDAFLNKGKMRSVLEKMDVKLVNQEKVGLYGALAIAQAQAK